MPYPKYNYLEIHRERDILFLTIKNPPNNTLPIAFFSELDACRESILSSEVAAVVFTGKGNVFSKGADVEELTAALDSLDKNCLIRANEVYGFLSSLRKPVIAAINGHCFGGGLELALACHIRVCAEKARIGLPEANIGLIPGLGGIQRLIRVVGEAKALEMILLGDMITSSRAYELNLVSRVFPKKDFLPSVRLFVRSLLATRKEALEEVLRLVALSRPENEKENILASVDSFSRLMPIRGV